MATHVSRLAAGSVEAWRTNYLYALGVPYEHAFDLAHLKSNEHSGFAIDVHYVESLIEGGATVEQALNLASTV